MDRDFFLASKHVVTKSCNIWGFFSTSLTTFHTLCAIVSDRKILANSYIKKCKCNCNYFVFLWKGWFLKKLCKTKGIPQRTIGGLPISSTTMSEKTALWHNHSNSFVFNNYFWPCLSICAYSYLQKFYCDSITIVWTA